MGFPILARCHLYIESWPSSRAFIHIGLMAHDLPQRIISNYLCIPCWLKTIGHIGFNKLDQVLIGLVTICTTWGTSTWMFVHYGQIFLYLSSLRGVWYCVILDHAITKICSMMAMLLYGNASTSLIPLWGESISHRSILLKKDGMGLLPDTQNRGCACAGNAGNVFPVTAGRRSRHASRHVRDARVVMHAGIAN